MNLLLFVNLQRKVNGGAVAVSNKPSKQSLEMIRMILKEETGAGGGHVVSMKKCEYLS